ncbi:MAG: hypothetical protein N4A76_06865 [Firmicutes bacterium]|nr:hypothetical protein [Bacillota bacterium]
MSNVKIDKSKNRMYINFEGFMKLDESIDLLNQCVMESKKLRSGYTVLSDTRNLKTLPQNVWDVIQKIRDNHVKQGVLKSAIIVNPKNHVSNMQVKRTMKDIKNYFPEEYFESESEALIYLES